MKRFARVTLLMTLLMMALLMASGQAITIKRTVGQTGSVAVSASNWRGYERAYSGWRCKNTDIIRETYSSSMEFGYKCIKPGKAYIYYDYVYYYYNGMVSDVKEGTDVWVIEVSEAEATATPTPVPGATAKPTPVPTPKPTSGSCGDHITWKFDKDTHVLTLTGKGDTNDYSTAPWNCWADVIDKVVVGEGITFIGQNCFDGIAATSVSLPSTLETIGMYAFSCCKNLNNLTIPEGVTKIGRGAFYSNHFTELTLPSTLNEIYPFAFAYSQNLTSITIPSGVTLIDDSAFEECDKLKTVILISN